MASYPPEAWGDHMLQTGLDTARKHVSPIECFWDGVFVPYLKNKYIGGRGRSRMSVTEK